MCHGCRWVCVAHPDKPWDDGCTVTGCDAEGIACVCNPNAEMPPGVQVIASVDEPRAVPDLRQCPFCAHAAPKVAELPVGGYVVRCPECEASGPPQPGNPPEIAVNAWNQRFGMDH
jgi:hypothetical protein